MTDDDNNNRNWEDIVFGYDVQVGEHIQANTKIKTPSGAEF